MLRSAVALALLLFPLLALVCSLRPASAGWAQAVLRAGALFGLILVAITEGLSAAHSLRALPLAVAWTAVTVVSLTAAVLAWLRAGRPRPTSVRVGGPVEWVLLALGVGVWAVQAVIAGASPPSNFDSLVYHMPRVVHWLQQGGVQFYQTSTDRQLYLGPGAEYVIATLQSLSHGDRWASMVSCVAAAGAAIAAGRIALLLGAGRRGCLAAALAAVTLPLGVLEATNTQNDFVVSWWIIAAVAGIVGDVRRPARWWPLLDIGAPLALAGLTKSTGFLILAPFLVWWAVVRLRRRPVPTLAYGIGIVVVVLLVNGPQLVRTQRTFGNPFGPTTTMQAVDNQRHDPAALASNVVRDVAVNLTSPVPGADRFLQRAVVDIHRVLGIPVSDPATTFVNQPFIAKFRVAEDYSGNGIQLLLIVVAAVWILWPGRRQSWLRRTYVLALLAAGLLFAGYLKWQPWITRLELPLFVCGCPVIGLLADAASVRGTVRFRVRSVVTVAAALSISLLALAFLWRNPSRPLVGPTSVFRQDRFDLIMANRPWEAGSYRLATTVIAARHPAVVGMAQTNNDLEYPLWVALRQRDPGVRLVSVTPNVDTLRGTPRVPDPHLVICLDITHRVCGTLASRGYHRVPGGSQILWLYAK